MVLKISLLPLSMISIVKSGDSIGEQVVRIQETAKAIAHLDVLASLACCGSEQ